MEQQIVSELYWPPEMDAAFNFGSTVRVHANDEVVFNNRLMTAGVAMKNWQVAVNYQGSKTVPQLPHLQVNHQYRLVMHASMKPANSVIIRLTFRDLQGNELKRYDFFRPKAYFTVPEETISYSLELINAGNEQIDFRRIEIGERQIDQAAYQDLWFQKPLNEQAGQPMNLLVVPANRRVKKTFPQLVTLADGLSLQVVLVDYQYTGNLSQDLAAYLRHHERFNDQIVSCSPQFDVQVLNVQRDLETVRTLVTSTHQARLNLFKSQAYDLPKVAEWANPTTVEPNWRAITAAIRKTSGGD